MKVVIEFYRIRAADDAHAVVGRETADANDLYHAIRISKRLCRTLNMPQRPDVVSIADSEGITLYSGMFHIIDDQDREICS
jgi:hypothetical protein